MTKEDINLHSFELITIDRNGKEISKKQINTQLIGKSYWNLFEVIKHMDESNTQILITTFNDKGRVLLHQVFELDDGKIKINNLEQQNQANENMNEAEACVVAAE